MQIDDAGYEAGLAHKRLSLELAQAYARTISARDQYRLSPSVAAYDQIFRASEAEIPKTEKIKYADTIIASLQLTIPNRKLALEKYELQRLLDNLKKQRADLN